MKKSNRFFLICGLVMAASEIWKQFSLTFIVYHGQYNWWYFPFQLCSIPMYICLCIPLVNSPLIRNVLLTFLMDFGLMGGIFTFFDTSGLHYSYAPLTVHSYAWHVLLIIIGITAELTLKAECSWKNYGLSVLFYLSACFIATVFNLVFYQYGPINMFYISPHYYLTQIVFEDIALAIGNTAGIFFYIAVIIAGAGIFHYIWRLVLRRLTESFAHKKA